MRRFVYVLIAIALVIFDQLLKFIFSDVNIDFGIFSLTTVRNTGISFGLFQGTNILIILISLLFLIVLWHIRNEFKGHEIFLAIIISGITGNLIDRVFRGFVLDYINLKFWPVFNAADTFLFIGVIGFVIVKVLENSKSHPSH